MLTETAPDGWVNVNDDFRCSKAITLSGQAGATATPIFICTASTRRTRLAGDAYMERQLTQGEFEVLAVAEIDATNGIVYFTCNKDDPRQQQFYSVRLDGSNSWFRRSGHARALFCRRSEHYVDEFSATLTPPRLSVCSSRHSCRTIWESARGRFWTRQAPVPGIQSRRRNDFVWRTAASGRSHPWKDSGDRLHLWRSSQPVGSR